MKHAIVIEHLAVEHAGTLKPLLMAGGYNVTPVPAAAIEAHRDAAEAADLVLVMGGPIGVYDAPEYPFLTKEIDLIQSRLSRKRPVLGICLGSQLMAAALGARVYPGDRGVELGWAPVALSAEGKTHPLAFAAGDGSPVLHWHGDTFDLPDGAVLLASTERYKHQAFAIGDYGLALQFHIETDEAELEQWFVAFASDIRAQGKETLPRLRADTRKFTAGLAERNARFIGEWIKKF